MNQSKKDDPRYWRKWHAAGSVKKEVYPLGTLLIKGIGTNYVNGHTTLSLGKNITYSDHETTVWKPVCSVVVPNYWMRLKNYSLNDILSKIPGNAVPVDIFYPRK